MKSVRLLPAFFLLSAFSVRAQAPAPDLGPARALYAQGRYVEAAPLAEAAAKAAPANAEAQMLYGQTLYRLRKPDEAVTALSAAVAANPGNAAAQTALGDAHMMRFMVQLRGWVKDHQNDMLGKIRSDIPSVYAGDPNAGGAAVLVDEMRINDRSSAQMNGKEWERLEKSVKAALATYQKALEANPAHKDAMRGKGLAQLLLGDWKDTLASWQAAGPPAFDSFLYEIARNIHDEHGMGEQAVGMWELVSHNDPTNAWAYWYLRDLYPKMRPKDWRLDYYDAMRKLFSDQIVDASDARKYTPKDALKGLEAITQAHPDFAPAWRGTGLAAQRLKDKKMAAAAFAKAAALDPNDWYSQLQHGLNQLTAGNASAARQPLANAAKQRPENALVWHAMGAAAEKDKDLDSAVTYYERAVENAPAWAEARYSLGALLLDRRQGAEALPQLQRYLELQPKAENAREVQTAIDQLKAILARQQQG